MSTYKDWIIQNNRITAPIFAILLSILVVLGAIYILGYLMFLVPVVTFLSFHYTKLYKLLPRFLGGSVALIIAALFATGMITHVTYNSNITYQADFAYSSNSTLANVTVHAQVTPYSGSSQQYTYNLLVIPNGTFNYTSLDLNIHGQNSFSVTVPYSSMSVQNFSGNNTEKLTYVFSGISARGVYSYNLTAQKNGTMISTPEISGPLNTSEFVIFQYLLPSLTIYYAIIFELVYVAGLFIGRSIGNSRRYREQRMQPEEKPKE